LEGYWANSVEKTPDAAEERESAEYEQGDDD
jgi:hypothetical protein